MNQKTFKEFQSFLIEKSGFYVPADRTDSLDEKVAERMKQRKDDSCEKYLHFLKFHPEGALEFRALLDLITIGETYFFRDGAQFEALREYVIAQIVAQRNNESYTTRRELRIWSAGCSSGEEPYSIAMVVRETIPNLSEWNISIIATDVNRKVLALAKKAVYNERAVREVPPAILEKYFTRHGRQFELAPEIQEMVRFESLNLARDPFTLAGMVDADIIFCRNVVIYFDLTTLKRVISQFADCLSSGGYLFIGHAETLWQISDAFETIEFPQTFIYRKLNAPSKKKVMLHIPLPSIEPEPQLKLKPEKKLKTYASENLRTSFQQATLLANEGQYEEALKILKMVVQEDNLYASAHYLIGVLYTKLEKYQEAIHEFRRVLYIDEKLAVGYYHLGNVYQFQEELLMAKKEYANCIKLLKNMEPDAPVPLSEGLTADVLYQATLKALDKINESNK